jgi:hypothetical protein
MSLKTPKANTEAEPLAEGNRMSHLEVEEGNRESEADVKKIPAAGIFKMLGFGEESAYNKKWMVQERRKTGFYKQRVHTYGIVLMFVLWFWGIAGFQFQKLNVATFKMGYRNAAAKLGCADPLACNRTTIIGLMEAEERAGHENYYRSIFCRFNLGCAWQFGFNTDFVTPNAVISNAGYWFVGLLILGKLCWDGHVSVYWKSFVPKCSRNKDSFVSPALAHLDRTEVYITMALGIMFTGFISAVFHMCPSYTTEQFDYTGILFSVLFAFIAIYHKRHVAPPPATHFWVFFSSCYFLSAFYVQMPVARVSSYKWFWMCVLVFFTVVGTWGLVRISQQVDKIKGGVDHRRMQMIRMRVLYFVCWALVTLGTIYQIVKVFSIKSIEDQHEVNGLTGFPVWMMGMGIVVLLCYLCYYLILTFVYATISHAQKCALGVRLLFTLLMWGPSMVFFVTYQTSATASLTENNKLNRPCQFGFFDYHDAWHFFSALGLFGAFWVAYSVDSFQDASDTHLMVY